MEARWIQWPVLALFLAVCFGAAGLGAAFTNLSVGDWYRTLQKPSWNPPDRVFGPVWTILYMGMAVSAWLVWRKKGLDGARLPFLIFCVQLLLNVTWSALFFGLQNPGLAFLCILFLWLAIVATVLAFRPVSSWAAGLLLPYLVWVTFASALNWTIWRLNS